MNKMKRTLFSFLPLIFLSLILTSGQEKTAGQKTKKSLEAALALQYQKFLKITAYIILPAEKEVFFKLATDRERDLFIETFWKQRDPTPGTTGNEYRDEILKRFEDVNDRFARGTSLEGWKTDMGRIYMILGPPASTESFEASLGLVPCVAWYYYGDTRKNLPPYFGLVFFQKGGAGPFRLYDPFSDGPMSLLQHKRDLVADDYEGLFDKIMDIAPTLADLSLSLIPGEYNANYQPSPRNNIIMANILESPKKDINPSYATHFLDYKGYVSTEYLTNYIETQGFAALIQDPVLNLRFVHFSVAPQKLSVDLYVPKDQYYCAFKVSVSLRKGEAVIYQYTKDFSVEIPSSELDRTRINGIAIEDTFPVIEGNYEMAVLLQNTVGKEFSVYEKKIDAAALGDRPQLDGPFVGYKIDPFQSDVHIPFKLGDKKLVFDPKMTFAAADEIDVLWSVLNLTTDLWRDGEVQLIVKGLRPNQPLEKSYLLKLGGSPYRKIVSLSHRLSGKDFSPDYYELKLILKGRDGKAIDEKTEHFVISPVAAIPHPIVKAKGFALANQFYYHYQLAHQYDLTGNNEKAEAAFVQAMSLNPAYKEGIVEFSNFLIKAQKFDRALELIENVKDYEKARYGYWLLRGLALMGKALYAEAIPSLLEGNKIYNSDTRLLNALGNCYARTDQVKQALEAYRASLKLNPNQEEVKKIVQGLEKSRESRISAEAYRFFSKSLTNSFSSRVGTPSF
jgi:GWxTD domain-containing protein